jgi:hypothetical protein
MNEYRTKLLKRYLQGDHFSEYERKKFNGYLDKINIMTYMKNEDSLEDLNPEYIAWCKVKIRKTNYELSKDENLIKFLKNDTK